MAIPPLPDIAGHSLDGGTYTIRPEENRLLCESVGVSPATDGRAHPIYSYIATQVGMGLSISELCSLCDFDVNDGLMLGSCDIRTFLPLHTGESYRVRGQVNGLTRKTSRKLGVMDVLDYALHLDLGDGTRACTISNTWILPRGHDDAA